MNKNSDDKALELIKKIEAVELSIKEAERPKYITNCVFKHNGNDVNFNILLTTESIIGVLSILVQLKNSYQSAAEFLGVDKYQEQLINGYTISEWMEDLKTRHAYVTIKEKKTKLAVAKKELAKNLTENKTKELNIDKIGDSIGDIL